MFMETNSGVTKHNKPCTAQSVVAMLLAGGAGSRLSVLSMRRAKPAVPFGGAYRIIDFVMTNIVRSGIDKVGILTQYKPYSLNDHLGQGEAWGFAGRYRQAKILPPYQGEADSDWYSGTADAIYQNIMFLDRWKADLVLVLSGDHIYRMDYRPMIEFHCQNNADLTIAFQPVPWEEVGRFGVAKLDEQNRVVEFYEKKADAPSNLASLGIYVFRKTLLEQRLREEAARSGTAQDFGKNIIPTMKETGDAIYGYTFNGYWRDVGTVQSYWETSMDCLNVQSGLDLPRWQILTNSLDLWGTKLDTARFASTARVSDSMIPSGCRIEGEVRRSILSPGCIVKKGALVEDSILFEDCIIGAGCQVHRVVADKHLRLGDGSQVGVGDPTPNREVPKLLNTGITLMGKSVAIPERSTIGQNVLFYPDLAESDIPSRDIPSGATIRARS
jgi:glucose-1-phosphate adenylyltransferase